MIVLRQLQQRIEAINDVQTGMDVRDYLVDEALRAQIPGAHADLPEQLFVRDDGPEVSLALYIAPEIVESLEADGLRIDANNLEQNCIALEGVSHFVYLAFRAQAGESVSCLELEIQAEVDKFVTIWLLLAEQGAPFHATADDLRRQLFESYELRDSAVEHADRYHTASHVARRYSQYLVSEFGRDRRQARIQKAARKFYRRGLSQKLAAN